jgi:hypothetical protein
VFYPATINHHKKKPEMKGLTITRAVKPTHAAAMRDRRVTMRSRDRCVMTTSRERGGRE